MWHKHPDSTGTLLVYLSENSGRRRIQARLDPENARGYKDLVFSEDPQISSPVLRVGSSLDRPAFLAAR